MGSKCSNVYVNRAIKHHAGSPPDQLSYTRLDNSSLNDQTLAHGAEYHSGGQRVLEVFIDAGQRCARIIVVQDHEGLPLMVVVQPGFDFLHSVRSPQHARRLPLLVEADSNEADVGGPEDALDLLTGEHLSPA